MTPAGYVGAIPLLPLAGAALLGLGGAPLQRRLGKLAVSVIACGTVAASFVLSVVAFLQLAGLAPEHRLLLADLFPWVRVGTLNVDVAFGVDPLSAVMILVVTGIGGLIHLYATGYMHDDPAFWRFFAYLNLFTFAMLTLVLGDNLLLMFVGWEGVGFCSWALIGFWHKELYNTTAGNKAFIVNRIGDFGFVLGLFLLFWTLDARGHGTLVFRELAQHAHLLEGQVFWGLPVATLVTLFLFIGATGKSAQIPLYVWLPDAMAGPTPVSALIHAATMVTAGVYMIARTNFLFAMAPLTLAVVATIGAATALLAATIALAQNDIKRVLAYSTVSQLGDGRVREHALDVVLRQRDGGGEERRRGADGRDHGQRERRHREEEVRPRDHVDAGRHHGGGVDQRRDRRRPRHRVREPDVEGDLRRLPGRADEEKERHQGRDRQAPEDLALEQVRVLGQLAEDERPMPARVQRPEEEEEAEHEAEVADAVHDEGLVAGRRVVELLVPEADQRPRAEADTLPADEHEEQVVAEDERQHGEGEQVEIREEAPERRVVVHVAGGVEVDQPADAGDHQDHHRGERVDAEGDVDVQRPDAHPREEVGEQEAVLRREPRELEERHHGEHERRRHRAARDHAHRELP